MSAMSCYALYQYEGHYVKEIQQMLSAFLENPFHYVPVVTNAPIYSERKVCRRRLTHKMFITDIEQQVKS